jgi:broad specificity phosphatase PhoE
MSSAKVGGMNKPLTFLLPVLLLGCASSPPPATASDAQRADAAGATTFILVRHAEKAADGSDDPPLTEAGRMRAQALAARLSTSPIIAVYTTPFQRTRQTATPTAQEHGLPLITYDAKQPAGDFSAQLQSRHAGQTVLVVGHSNTVPGIAAALCRCQVAPMSESEYDRLTTVRIARDGTATLREASQH